MAEYKSRHTGGTIDDAVDKAKRLPSTIGTAGQVLKSTGMGMEWGDASAVVDPTLSIPGAAADAAVTGQRITALNQRIDGLPTNDYVTPEMFGAVGDGVADDTDAIQGALNSGVGLVLMNSTYKTTETIEIKQGVDLISFGTINYNGTAFAVKFSGVIPYIRCELGTINAPNGNCVLISDADGWKQYIYVSFKQFTSNKMDGVCVDIDAGNAGNWVNELHIRNGRFNNALYGVRCVNHSAQTKGHFNFYSCGFEGVETGVILGDFFTEINFFGCRAEESINKLFASTVDANNTRRAQDVHWHGKLSLAYTQGFTGYYLYVYGEVKTTDGVLITAPSCLVLNDRLYGHGVQKQRFLGAWVADEDGIMHNEFISNGLSSKDLYSHVRTDIVPAAGATLIVDMLCVAPEKIHAVANTLTIICSFAPNSTLTVVDTAGNVLATYTNTGATSIYSYNFTINYIEDFGYEFSPLAKTTYKNVK